ncbi:hypothetical protein TYRP_021310 [Tyrophagus putrescentiae]|nr:hypothetical protein TYRP_021310 [Tyrophagus putrescentiae]
MSISSDSQLMQHIPKWLTPLFDASLPPVIALANLLLPGSSKPKKHEQQCPSCSLYMNSTDFQAHLYLCQSMPTRKERELAIDLADWHRTKRCNLTGLSQHIDNMRMAVTKDSSSRTSPPSLSHFESHKSFCSDKEPRCFEPALRLVKYHLEYFPRFSLRYTAYGPNDDKLDSAIKKEKEIAIRQAALLKLTKGMEDVVLLINDLLFSASQSASRAKEIIGAIKDEIEEVTREKRSVIGDVVLLSSFTVTTDASEIKDDVDETSPVRRHIELHQRVPNSLLPSVLILVKTHLNTMNSRGYSGVPVFELIDGITKMGSDGRFASMYLFTKFDGSNEWRCSRCTFSFISNTPYGTNTHEALCSAVSLYDSNKTIMKAVREVASFALRQGGIAYSSVCGTRRVVGLARNVGTPRDTFIRACIPVIETLPVEIMDLAESIFYDGSFSGNHCNQCNLGYANLREHEQLCFAVIDLMLKYYSPEPSIACQYCAFTFQTREAMTAHGEFCASLSDAYSSLQKEFIYLAHTVLRQQEPEEEEEEDMEISDEEDIIEGDDGESGSDDEEEEYEEDEEAEEEEEVIVIKDDDDDVQIVEPKFAGKYTDLPPLPKPDWNKEPPHWKHAWNKAVRDDWANQTEEWLNKKRSDLIDESLKKWEKWQKDTTVALKNTLFRQNNREKTSLAKPIEVYSDLENMFRLVNTMERAKARQDRPNGVKSYCGKCELYYTDVHFRHIVKFSTVIVHAQLVGEHRKEGTYLCTGCSYISFKTKAAAAAHQKICKELATQDVQRALAMLVDHVVKKFSISTEIPTNVSTGYYSKKIKSAETCFSASTQLRTTTSLSGSCSSRTEVFRRGEYAITKYKTRHCLYCSLYYQPLYISAHTKLCRENEKPDDQRYSRAYWYNAAKARFDRLSEAEKKYGVDDTAVLAGVRVYETPAGQLKTTCPPNCNKLTGDNIEKYEQHARLHRREYPYFCIHCKDEYFFGYELMRTHLSKCGSYKKFLEAIKEISSVTDFVECGRPLQTPCSVAGPEDPLTPPARSPRPPGPPSLPGSPQHRRKTSAALAAADQQVDKSSSKSSCIASSGVIGRCLVSSAATAPSEAPKHREAPEECPWPAGVPHHHHKSTGKTKGLEQPQQTRPAEYLASLGTRSARHRVLLTRS